MNESERAKFEMYMKAIEDRITDSRQLQAEAIELLRQLTEILLQAPWED